jgi:hypothetical protein
MIPFSAMFTLDFFLTLAFVAAAVTAMIFSARYHRADGSRTSLFLLVATAFLTAYQVLQLLLGSFISYWLGNYAAQNPEFQLPAWINPALSVLFYALNYGFVIALALAAWFGMRKSRALRLAEHESVEPESGEPVLESLAEEGEDVAEQESGKPVVEPLEEEGRDVVVADGREAAEDPSTSKPTET